MLLLLLSPRKVLVIAAIIINCKCSTSSTSSLPSDPWHTQHRSSLRGRRNAREPYGVVVKDSPVPSSVRTNLSEVKETPQPSWAWEVLGQGADDPAARACKVYCTGELLKSVQMSAVFEDSKEFVDMPMRYDPEIVLHNFNQLEPADRQNVSMLRTFLLENFYPPGADLAPIDPVDFTTHPSVLDKLTPNSSYYNWASTLNLDWKQLIRHVSADVFANPQRYSILRVNHPFVVPGGRFGENYYWDSYWIILGLLACDMKETAKGVVQNMLDSVGKYGFVPNGGRVYYLNRSQPPLLSEMVFALLEADETLRHDTAFLSSAVAALDTEYQHWMHEGEHVVTVTDEQGETYRLNRFYTQTSYPRPESYKEDVESNMAAPITAKLYGGVYANIAAGAESGWDFSSRWIVPGQNGIYSLSDIQTLSVLPVDLNACMYRMERNLGRLHEVYAAAAGGGSNSSSNLPPFNYSLSTYQFMTKEGVNYTEAADRRALAMDRFMWEEESGYWKDYVIPRVNAVGRRLGEPGQGVVSISGFLPLWSNVLGNEVVKNGSAKAAKALEALRNSGLIQVGGIQTTTEDTAEQWDSPNAWAPMQQMMIEGLERLTYIPEAVGMAHSLAKQWLESNYLGWVATGYMNEKYNALVPGARGEGGEYYPQVGFGWTNGVVLHLLNKYGDRVWQLENVPPASPAAADGGSSSNSRRRGGGPPPSNESTTSNSKTTSSSSSSSSSSNSSGDFSPPPSPSKKEHEEVQSILMGQIEGQEEEETEKIERQRRRTTGWSDNNKEQGY